MLLLLSFFFLEDEEEDEEEDELGPVLPFPELLATGSSPEDGAAAIWAGPRLDDTEAGDAGFSPACSPRLGTSSPPAASSEDDEARGGVKAYSTLPFFFRPFLGCFGWWGSRSLLLPSSRMLMLLTASVIA